MNQARTLESSVPQIRRRLLTLLFRAYSSVLMTMVGLLFTALMLLILSVSRSENLPSRPLASILETYYSAHGSWENIDGFMRESQDAFSESAQLEWRNSVLLDSAGEVLVDRGRPVSAGEGNPFKIDQFASSVNLYANGKKTGSLVIDQVDTTFPWRLVRGVFAPLVFIALLLAILTIVIGILLTRRVVYPLSEVISASQKVAAGDLATRVSVQGPDDLRLLSDSFNQMASTLERNERERREMLTDIAHELRTPITIMRGRLEGIVDGIYSPDETHIASILEETYLLERLVEDLRLLALAETHQLQFNMEPVDLVVQARQVVDFYKAEAREAKIAMKVRVRGEIPRVSADALRIKQVIGNLISNAMRYVPAGGDVAVEVSATTQDVILQARDNGPGVSENDLPRVFDRFWRGEKSRSRATGGAGLGLAVARQLIESQGGRIWAKNRPGGGLEVGFSLPAQPHTS